MKKITTRAIAIRDLKTSYYTDKPCKHGHYAERDTMSGACKRCLQLSNKRNTEKRRKFNNALAEKMNDD